MVLSWFENLPADDVPPRHYWHSPTHLKEWFESVAQKKKDRAAGYDPIDDDEDMTENELAKGLRG